MEETVQKANSMEENNRKILEAAKESLEAAERLGARLLHGAGGLRPALPPS